MEVIQGNSKDKKIVIAQEIAFAKVLAGNNKTLRDRAVKKLKKWLTLRGNGKWTFTEEEFLRLWTGLFYCMWMSDKFLIQEELAESISSLIHCFKKNSESALLFIKCFNKRILMDWEGLDQYRIDKFNMFVRRFLRQAFVYCKEKDWEESFLHKLMEICYNVILHQDNSLGFVVHFIGIYAEELAKVSKGKIKTEVVLLLIEPFIKLLARSVDIRIQKETENFFTYLMRQTDTGIEFEERFNAWKEQGFPGEGPHCMENLNDQNEDKNAIENGDDLYSEEEDENEEEMRPDEPLDPRAGSVHVFLPQIPLDLDGLIQLFKKHQNSKQTNPKGKRILKSLIQKFEALKRGRFPVKIKKHPILTEPVKKKRRTVKNAKELLKFTQKIDYEPVKTKEFQTMMMEMEKQSDSSDSGEELDEKSEDVEHYETIQQLKQGMENHNQFITNKRKEKVKNAINKLKKGKEQEISNKIFKEVKENGNLKENIEKKKKVKKRKNRKVKEKQEKQNIPKGEIVVKSKKKHKINGIGEEIRVKPKKITPLDKTVRKQKILSNWQVQELDSDGPDYNKIETPKLTKLQRKISESSGKESEVQKVEEDGEKNEWEIKETSREEIFPVFWEKAKKKVFKSTGTKGKMFLNPFANVSSESKSQNRRISFALDKNMSQENEEYLEEVKNSPRVPFDGSKKPIQSALKSGLAPSPVNPFYRFKKIKF